MVFMTALADFGTPGILAGGDFRTLPVLIFNEYLSETGGNANLASAISMIIVVISLLILFLQKWWVARKNYTMSALRPPQITEYRGWKRFLVTLPVAVVSLVSFLPQVIVIFCSFVKTNYSNFVFSEGFTLEHYLELGKSLSTNIRNSFGTVCVVTRYFGGILLGAGGLTRAYGGTAKLTLDAAGISRMRLWAVLAVPCPYPMYERMRLLVEKSGGTVENADFGTDVLLTVLLPAEDVDAFQEKVTELSAGTIEVLVEEERFQPGPP